MRLRFTIRDLLWLVVVVSPAMGWATYNVQARHEQEKLLLEVKRANAEGDRANTIADAWESKFKLRIAGDLRDSDAGEQNWKINLQTTVASPQE
jgi:hypothetical protein